MRRSALHGWPTVLVLSLTARAIPSQDGAATSRPTSRPADWKPGPTPFAVEVRRDLVLEDPARRKDLRVTLLWPAGEGPFPVIVFSHGAGGSGSADFPLVRHWAGHGYVCLLPTHADSRRGDATGRTALRDALSDSGPEGLGAREARAGDVSFVIDSLARIEELVPDLAGRLDRKKLGVAGHSLGAFTAQVLAGATLAAPGVAAPKCLADQRPQAFLLLSAQGVGQMGLHADSWKDIARPLMVVTGSRDRGMTGQGPEEKLDSFKRSAAGDKYGLLIEGARHGSFLGRTAERPESRPRQRRMLGEASEEAAIFGWMKAASLAFLDAYVKDDAAARAWLQADALRDLSAGNVDFRRR